MKRRGRGYAAVNYPTGMNLGGDPSQALIHSTTTGTFVVTLSSVDLGQGIKTIAAQCAAETLGLPYENILVDTADTDTGPHCMGTFASRGTHRVRHSLADPDAGSTQDPGVGFNSSRRNWNCNARSGARQRHKKERCRHLSSPIC